jgi:hypothetical protein
LQSALKLGLELLISALAQAAKRLALPTQV